MTITSSAMRISPGSPGRLSSLCCLLPKSISGATPFRLRSQARVLRLLLAFMLLFAGTAVAAGPAVRNQQAREQFEKAEQMREALNGRPAEQRTRKEFQRVADAYRKVYYVAPGSSKADVSVVAVAEVLAEMGRQFDPGEKYLRAAISEYEFLRREYPGSKYRFQALFTIGQIYKEDLGDEDAARATFEEFLHRYPRNSLAPEAKEALADLNKPPAPKKPVELARAPERPAKTVTEEVRPAPKSAPARKVAEEPHPADKSESPKKPAEDARTLPPPANDERADDSHQGDLSDLATASASKKKAPLPLVTGIRHWSTPDYTRVAIDLDAEVKYEAGRVPDPDRIFFDLPNTKLASVLVGKSFDVRDGFLKKIRVAQYQPGYTRVVLEVADVSDYSAFLLPNPYRLIIDIHGRQPQAETKVASATAPPLHPSDDSGSTVVEKEKSYRSVEKANESKQGSASSTKPATPIGPQPAPASTAKNVRKVVVSDDDDDDATPELKATTEPTTAPTAIAVAPRAKNSTKTRAKTTPPVNTHVAEPTSSGERSLTRALGLKIGRIVVDAGHGGHDTGTIGPSGLAEKEVVLDVALRLGRLLETRLGADVIYTRDDDTFIPLETRTAIANEHQADLFVSIHANSSPDPMARGVETYYLNFTSNPDALEVAARENAVSQKSIFELQDLVKKITLKDKIEESRELATDVQQSLYTGLADKHSTLRDRGVKKAPFVVLIGANMPSILAEISFVSNPGDEARLETPEYRQKIAESLYKGIAQYAGGLSGMKVAAKFNKASEAGN
jgi:N-acetylmuramoyl-L-alanine amidase